MLQSFMDEAQCSQLEVTSTETASSSRVMQTAPSGQNPYEFLLVVVPAPLRGAVAGGHEPQAQLGQLLAAHVRGHHDFSLQAVTQSSVGGQRVPHLPQVLVAFRADSAADLPSLHDGLWSPDGTAGALGEGQGADLVLVQEVLETILDSVEAIKALLHLLRLTERKAVH